MLKFDASVDSLDSLPMVCVACGTTATEVVEYSQDNIPIIGPGIGYISWREVIMPYCADHAKRFKSRFQLLRFGQAFLFIAGFICICFPLLNNSRNFRYFFHVPMSEQVEFALGLLGLSLIVLSAFSFLVKPFLYDVRVSKNDSGIVIKAKNAVFIDAVIEASNMLPNKALNTDREDAAG